jgi:hypothetical protein
LSHEVALWADTLNAEVREWFEERAAIYEFDAGMSRNDAEVASKQATERFFASPVTSPAHDEKTPKNRK